MRYYVVDVFAEELFRGNPAGVLILQNAMEEGLMQRIAAENNLSETAFVVPRGDHYDLRWFTPETEIDLCGHATLASAFVLSEFEAPGLSRMEFHTQSGVLKVEIKGDVYVMDFPSRPPVETKIDPMLEAALGCTPLGAYLSRDLMVLLESERQIKELKPDFTAMKKMKDCFAVIVTAKGDSADFVSRFFAPGAGIQEDPVTGSSHCTLIPFWAQRLGKRSLTARQLSARGGTLYCEDCGTRVKIGGRAVLYLKGELSVQ